VEHRQVETGRLRVHIAEAGTGPPLLLLHGWPQHWYAWRKLIPLLAGSRRLICPDLRGFGWTDAPDGGYRTADLAADVVALLDALELDRVDVIGHGEGGRVGFELCLSQPSRVGRLVTLGAMHPLPEPPPPHSAGVALLVDSAGRDVSAGQAGDRASAGGYAGCVARLGRRLRGAERRGDRGVRDLGAPAGPGAGQ
jgi:pimeloyl-ACP methyl ester carboxylesterase